MSKSVLPAAKMLQRVSSAANQDKNKRHKKCRRLIGKFKERIQARIVKCVKAELKRLPRLLTKAAAQGEQSICVLKGRRGNVQSYTLKPSWTLVLKNLATQTENPKELKVALKKQRKAAEVEAFIRYEAGRCLANSINQKSATHELKAKVVGSPFLEQDRDHGGGWFEYMVQITWAAA